MSLLKNLSLRAAVFGGTVKSKLSENKGAGIVEYIIIVLVALVVGGVLLTLFSGSISEIWTSMINKIKSTFSI